MKNKEMFEALKLLEEERGIPFEFMVDKIKKAIVTACKSNYNGNEDVIINLDEKKSNFEVYLRKTVVEEVKDSGNEISILEARVIDANTEEGEKIPVKLDTKEFGRIAAQTARNIIRQGIRDGERGIIFQQFEDRRGELVSATVEKIDPRSGLISLKIGKADVFLPKNEQLPNDDFHEGDHVKVYVADVKDEDKGPKAIISRIHPDMIRRMFESEVPEIYDGTVEIKAISREAGARTKIAVFSRDKNVDAIGACIGPKGSRVGSIVDELCGEKIDIIEYNEDPIKFISASLSPAEVLQVNILDEKKHVCSVSVPDDQLSLAIGNKGQNARLAAKLTSWKIDIKPNSSFESEVN